MNSMKSAANDLFLLMLNLSQMSTKENIIEVFIGAIKAIWPNIKVKHLTSKTVIENNLLQISTGESNFGYLQINNLVEFDNEDEGLLYNACGMLAVILKKIEQDLLLTDEKLLLQKSVQERTQHLSEEIEERKKIEKKLKKSEEKYHSLFKNINVGVALHEIIVNKDGKPIDFVYLDVNPAYEKLTTLKKKDIIGKRGLDVIPKLEQKWIDLYGEIALTGKSISIIDHSEFLDKYWDIKAYSPSKNQFAVALTDITDKIKAEQDIIKAKEKAEENEELLNLTGETAKVGGWRLNLEFNKVLWTKTTGRIHELPDDYIPTLEEATNFYHDEDQALVKESVEKAVKKGIQYEIEVRLITAKGNLIWVKAIGKPEMQDGKCIGLSGSFQDITQNRHTEEALVEAKEKAEENEEKYKLLHENAGLGIGYYTPEGVVISFNSIASRDMNGFPEDFTGKSIFDLFPKKHADFYLERIQKAIHTDEITVYEDCVTLPTKEKWFLSTYTKIVNSQKKVLGIQIISQNITEIKQFEVELKNAKEKAEQADKLKSAFLANMSHEIRTPMNGILGFSTLLKEADLSGKEQQEYIKIIEKSGARMLNIINDIISISKIESGQMEVNLQESNINEQIEFIYNFFKLEVEQKGLTFSYRNDLPASNSIISTDSEKLYAVLTNLVKNAIKYCEKGTIQFGYDKIGEYLQFFVQDTGIGIPENRTDAIFERFIQADITDKMARQGAGLGLSISKAYIEMLGGKIWVDSIEGKGSVFYFTIPYITKNETSQKIITNDTKEEDAIEIKKLKILIVEDDETSLMLLNIMIEKISKEVLTASNGLEAVEYCRNNPDTDLVLMDIQMPVMNGFEATKQIREFNKDVIIIAQTAFALKGDKKKVVEAGCNDYMSKPIKRERLLEIISEHF